MAWKMRDIKQPLIMFGMSVFSAILMMNVYAANRVFIDNMNIFQNQKIEMFVSLIPPTLLYLLGGLLMSAPEWKSSRQQALKSDERSSEWENHKYGFYFSGLMAFAITGIVGKLLIDTGNALLGYEYFGSIEFTPLMFIIVMSCFVFPTKYMRIVNSLRG